MNETQNELVEVEIYGYINAKGQKVYTPNLEFAKIMVNKYCNGKLYIEKN
jgi:hypothetical protein